ncbi:Glutamate-ammonia-ligase adenylyltransferase [Sterolibacterium denitrificans]|uniref:Glutamate-ammonia-ligase adenylyltransferase n=2 Tax=Sterolibacterium denitrificans TaxID=157592 RepID=A0A7Z7HQD9_9PROT|nr:bifunctional [glutamate--ammonia ligase]-adenylyl-L-tyrosine phosphorylase/[glutamate--ammonia-ligase] adenylyltransferase [Sterolibacterium denitrificans]KYC28938.1 glutamine-synthetase adenylyltransferase [Sterolibacterium denitrificans]SMB23228.1 Glutamate-ammonia-ligase adenylyltransferase [Sterolibacterium denitrificans]
MPSTPTPADILHRILPWSRALARLLAARPALVDEIDSQLSAPLDSAGLLGFLPATLDEDSLKPALRHFKQRAYARLAARDLAGLASLGEVTESMTLIAETALATAQRVLMQALVARYGQPRSEAGEPQQLIVIGMGKLGGRELNVSSDIDLIFLYPENGQTDGTGSNGKHLDNFEFFTRLGRGLIGAIGEITEDGQVFRVDMRLRPNGDSGPLVCCFDMLENYFITQGREWERYAWIKARALPTAGESPHWPAWMSALEDLRRPFVFRKYLDFGSIEAMRELHVQIRREVARKDMADNIKLGPGGIREIEFIAQAFQLIRGGRDERLRIRPTLQVLPLLAERRQLSQASADELAAAYGFLRRLEHRLQYLDDAQTHELPDPPADQALIAAAMGHADYAALLAELDGHRAIVSRHFDAVFADPHLGRNRETDDGPWHGDLADAQPDGNHRTAERLVAQGYHDGAGVAVRLAALHAGNRYQQMPSPARKRFDALMPHVIETCAATTRPDAALFRVLDLLEAVSRRPAYLSLLLQYPLTLQKLAQLAAASLWAAEYLKTHPILLDELLDPSILDIAPDWQAFRQSLELSLEAAEPDTEQQMNLLREAHHSQVFRLLVQDIDGVLTVEKLADHLSALADLMLELALKYAWRKIARRHVDTPRFAIISYGKLGGKELGYASDLDLIFVMDDPDPAAGENYARLATRLNTWLSSQTTAGSLFDIDLRLRPNGESGLTVVSLDALRQYQLESAWVWEHQALTRARFSAGDRKIGAAFENIRDEILRQPRDRAALRREVSGMRHKMHAAHATPAAQAATTFDLKHDRGGLVDVEFIVQYLVLGYAHDHPQLTGNLGNIALLKIAGELGLIPPELAEAVRNAYRDYRRLQHGARLNNAKARVAPDNIAAHISAVRALWLQVFGSE